MLAFTGLETVANLAEEARRPGVDLPRSVFGAIATVVTVYVAIAVVALSAFPGPNTELGTTWIQRAAARRRRPHRPRAAVRISAACSAFYVGITGALILLAAVTTSISGFSRLAYSLGEHGQLPRSVRAAEPPRARLAARDLRGRGRLVGDRDRRRVFKSDDVAFLASLFSFGVLLAFTAAQLAVIKLRIDEPDLPRPYRAPFNVTIRGSEIPLPAIVGAIATFAIWVIAIATHPAARYAGPLWLARRARRLRQRAAVPRRGPDRARRGARRASRSSPSRSSQRILVPMKLGDDRRGDARHRGQARVRARGGGAGAARDPRPARAAARRAAARPGRAGGGVARRGEAARRPTSTSTVEGTTVRARAIGHAIVAHATEVDADLIVLGSAPRWRRQSRFFSPTVDYVLRQAPCEVLIVAFPQTRARRGARGDLTSPRCLTLYDRFDRRTGVRHCDLLWEYAAPL